MSKKISVLQVIEDALGDSLTEKEVTGEMLTDISVRKRIANAYHEYESSPEFSVPQRGQNEVFPYVHPRWKVGSSFGGYLKDFTQLEAIEDVERNIKKVLLYYHRLAIPCAFGYLCDRYRYGEPKDKRIQDSFTNYLLLYVRLRKLIEDEVIFFIPEFPSYFPARDAVASLNRERVRNNPIVGEFVGGERIVGGILQESLWVAKKFDMDLFLPNTQAVEVIEGYARDFGKTLTGSRKLDAISGSILLQCDLPALEQLTIQDMILVRGESDAFSSWRSGLRRVLQSSYEDLLNDSFDPYEMRRFAAEEFAGARKSVDDELRKSSALGLGKTGFNSVGVGILVGLATATLFEDPVATISTSLATAGSTFLYDYVKGKFSASSKKNSAIRAHYAVWDSAVNK